MTTKLLSDGCAALANSWFEHVTRTAQAEKKKPSTPETADDQGWKKFRASQKKISGETLLLTSGEVIILRALVSRGVPPIKGGEGGSTWEDLRVLAEGIAKEEVANIQDTKAVDSIEGEGIENAVKAST